VLRTAGDDDRDKVLAWRNHPEVRRASLTTHMIGADEHRSWWRAVQQDPTRSVLIYERAGRPAGVVTITDHDPVARSASWGYYLDLAGLRERGDLLPAWLEVERDVVRYAFDELKLDRLGGETLAWNTQVLALHRRFGFRVTRRYTRPVDGVPQEVVWTELRSTDRRAGATAAAGGPSTTPGGTDVLA
jgi:UDP-4-amino-4,6-dideoxy-N-acetyl-beta-L-altrosamine N-acetyltransferase